jgi:HEPN domain-containing protein
MAETDLEVVRMAVERQLSFHTCRGKLAEVLEKLLKAELLRLGWILEKTHDLDRLLDELVARQSDLVSLVEPLCDVLAEVYFTDRYPGFDLDDPDWPALNLHVQQTTQLLERIWEKLTSTN